MITKDVLEQDIWIFSRGNDASWPWTRMKFNPDGTVGLYRHPHQARWTLTDGILSLVKQDGRVSTRFDQTDSDGDRLRLSGRFILHPSSPIVHSLEQFDRARFPPFASMTKVHFADMIAKLGWVIGDHTYGKPSVLEPAIVPAKLTIGKYTSIGPEVTLGLGNHRTDFVSTYPFATLWRHWPHAPNVADHVTHGDIVIGNDVWIGGSAFVRSGIAIGDGAVVGAHAVVTKDVPPYAIVVGNPAVVKSYRFSESVIEALLEIAWWEWPDETVDGFLVSMMSADIGAFIEKARAISAKVGPVND